jgi:ribosomal protein L21E
MIVLFFRKHRKRGAARLKETLKTYNLGSGQVVNKKKSTVFFISNCDEQVKQEFKHVLHIKTEDLPDKYSSLSIAFGRSSTN